MKCVIMAGGRGTRISSVAKDIPKPMLRIAGKPVLEHEIENLREQGITEFIITVSHLKAAIMEYFGDGSGCSPVTGNPFGVHIEYFVEEQPMGNAGALFQLREQLTEDFLLVNGDVIFDVDVQRFIAYHREKQGLVTLFTHPNSHPYDSGIIVADDEGKVEEWLTKEDVRSEFYKNRVNAGLHILSPKLLENTPQLDKIDLDRNILKPLAGRGCMYAYDSTEYVRDMGTPERFQAVCEDYMQGKIQARNLKQKQKAIFLDRDGTLNKYVGFLRSPEEMELLPGVEEAVAAINSSDYLAVVVTNQPVIARGEVTFEELAEIHNKLETLLGNQGAYLDKIYLCPHHPDRGYDGERAEYKVVCDCRKPKPGMLLQAAKELNIDLEASWMVGDSERDVQAGKSAGCRTALIGNKEVGQDVTVDSLREFVQSVIMNREI